MQVQKSQSTTAVTMLWLLRFIGGYGKKAVLLTFTGCRCNSGSSSGS